MLMSLTLFTSLTLSLLYSEKKYELSFVIMLLSIALFFLTEKVLTFYIIFEFSLIPTIFLVLRYGYQPERFQASIYILLYTIFSSLPFLLWIMSSGSWFLDLETLFSYRNLRCSVLILVPSLPFLVKLPI